MSAILDSKGVIQKAQLAEMMLKLAGIVDMAPEGAVGADMLRKVYEIITEAAKPKWKPTIV